VGYLCEIAADSMRLWPLRLMRPILQALARAEALCVFRRPGGGWRAGVGARGVQLVRPLSLVVVADVVAVIRSVLAVVLEIKLIQHATQNVRAGAFQDAVRPAQRCP